jgi:hypothetical protein
MQLAASDDASVKGIRAARSGRPTLIGSSGRGPWRVTGTAFV